MDEGAKLNAFLKASSKRIAQFYAQSFMRKLAIQTGARGGRVAIVRAVAVDLDTQELIVTDTVETRIQGPVGSPGPYDA